MCTILKVTATWLVKRILVLVGFHDRQCLSTPYFHRKGHKRVVKSTRNNFEAQTPHPDPSIFKRNPPPPAEWEYLIFSFILLIETRYFYIPGELTVSWRQEGVPENYVTCVNCKALIFEKKMYLYTVQSHSRGMLC